MVKEKNIIFEASIDTNKFKQMLEIIKSLSGDVKLNISKKGIHSIIVDPAHVALLDFVISDKAFEKFNADNLVIAISVDDLLEFIKKACKNDMTYLMFEENKNKLLLKNGIVSRHFNLLDTETLIDPKIPELSLNGGCIIPVKQLSIACSAVECVSEQIKFIINKDEFKCENDNNDVSVVFSGAEDITITGTKKKITALFSIDFLIEHIKHLFAEKIKINFSHDAPVSIECENLDMKTNYILAPRVENE